MFSFVSDVAWLHNRHYPVVWMYSLTCIQPGGGDDHADQRKALHTQSICSRSHGQTFLHGIFLSWEHFATWLNVPKVLCGCCHGYCSLLYCWSGNNLPGIASQFAMHYTVWTIQHGYHVLPISRCMREFYRDRSPWLGHLSWKSFTFI